MAFYDQMFDHCQPAEAIDKHVGEVYIRSFYVGSILFSLLSLVCLVVVYKSGLQANKPERLAPRYVVI